MFTDLYSVIDTETTTRNKGEGAVGTFSASPFSDRNYIVALGEWWVGAGKYIGAYVDDPIFAAPFGVCWAAQHKVPVLLVMHNAAFDLAYIAKTWPKLFMEALPNLSIWDTQQGEYLLSGQTHLYPSLDECCEARGFPLKDNRIKEYWEQGIDTTLIPKDELLPYLEGDVLNTRLVFLSQLNEMQGNPKLLALMEAKGRDILFTTMASVYGMNFDLQIAQEKLQPLDEEINRLYNVVVGEVVGCFPEDAPFNPNTPEHVSLALFGGTLHVERDVPTGAVFKTGPRAGMPKTKKTKVPVEIKGLGLDPGDIPKLRKGFQTDDESLSKLNHPWPKALLKYRELYKDASTYYRGYSALVWPDGKIRPSYNHESTRTGRQSCSSPNLQNVSAGED